MFETVRFLKDNFDDVDGVRGLIEKHYERVPEREAVRKWFSRRQVSAEWLPVLILVLQMERGALFDIAPYFHSGGPQDVFG